MGGGWEEVEEGVCVNQSHVPNQSSYPHSSGCPLFTQVSLSPLMAQKALHHLTYSSALSPMRPPSTEQSLPLRWPQFNWHGKYSFSLDCIIKDEIKPWANKWAKFKLTAAPHGPLWADTPASLATGFELESLGCHSRAGWCAYTGSACQPQGSQSNLWGIYKLTAQQVNRHHCLHTCKQKYNSSGSNYIRKAAVWEPLKISLMRTAQLCEHHRNTNPHGCKL